MRSLTRHIVAATILFRATPVFKAKGFERVKKATHVAAAQR
jgi:hypothetical protein